MAYFELRGGQIARSTAVRNCSKAVSKTKLRGRTPNKSCNLSVLQRKYINLGEHIVWLETSDVVQFTFISYFRCFVVTMPLWNLRTKQRAANKRSRSTTKPSAKMHPKAHRSA